MTKMLQKCYKNITNIKFILHFKKTIEYGKIMDYNVNKKGQLCLKKEKNI